MVVAERTHQTSMAHAPNIRAPAAPRLSHGRPQLRPVVQHSGQRVVHVHLAAPRVCDVAACVRVRACMSESTQGAGRRSRTTDPLRSAFLRKVGFSRGAQPFASTVPSLQSVWSRAQNWSAREVWRACVRACGVDARTIGAGSSKQRTARRHRARVSWPALVVLRVSVRLLHSAGQACRAPRWPTADDSRQLRECPPPASPALPSVRGHTKQAECHPARLPSSAMRAILI